MRRLAGVGALVLAVAVLAIVVAPAPARTPAEPREASADWVRYGHDDQLTNGAEFWTRWLGAPLYSPPIFAEGRVVVATMGGQVYALDLRH